MINQQVRLNATHSSHTCTHDLHLWPITLKTDCLPYPTRLSGCFFAFSWTAVRIIITKQICEPSYSVDVSEEVTVAVRPVAPCHTYNKLRHFVPDKCRHVSMTCNKQLIDCWTNQLAILSLSVTAIMTNVVLWHKIHTRVMQRKKLPWSAVIPNTWT